MSKRHQTSRRRSYGRRQHELRERSVRQPDVEPLDAGVEHFGRLDRDEAFDRVEVDPFGARFRFALAD
jgi:hypothetical protein